APDRKLRDTAAISNLCAPVTLGFIALGRFLGSRAISQVGPQPARLLVAGFRTIGIRSWRNHAICIFDLIVILPISGFFMVFKRPDIIALNGEAFFLIDHALKIRVRSDLRPEASNSSLRYIFGPP